MDKDRPPPYFPSEGPSAPSPPTAFSSQHATAAFPAASYQTFPQSYTGAEDPRYYQGPPGPPYPTGPPGPPYQPYPPGSTGPQGPPYSPGPPYQPYPAGPFQTQPGYQGFHSRSPGAPGPWAGPRTYREQPKHTVFVVEQSPDRDRDHGDSGGGGVGACLAGCAAALCFCCLWDTLNDL